MARLKSGDKVDVRIKESTIVSPYKNYDEIKTFEIVAEDDHGYYLYVPYYYVIHGAIVVDEARCRIFGIDKRFLNEYIVFIDESTVYRIHTLMDGMHCYKCKEFYSYAEANQYDGSLICWSCKNYPYH